MTIQIYGQFASFNSNAIVSRGIACGLAKNNVDVRIYDPSSKYNGMWERLTTGLGRAPVGIYVGYPTESPMYLELHQVKVGAFICESSSIPGEWGAIAAACDLVIFPSHWVAEAFIRAGVSPQKMIVMPHGLHPQYANRCEHLPPTENPRFLHLAGAPTFRERKGTYKLVKAFHKLLNNDHPRAELHIKLGVLDPALVGEIEKYPQFKIHEGAPLSPKDMWKFYYEGWSAIVLPSRAEAFGMAPVEARALGLPCIITDCSGHAEHTEPWDTFIEHGRESKIQVNGIPNGMAPSVTVDAIYKALKGFMTRREKIRQEAIRLSDNYYRKYDWRVLTRPLANRISKLGKKFRKMGGEL